LGRPIPNSTVKKNGKQCGGKKPKYFSNDGGDNHITAKHVRGQMFKQLTYCCYSGCNKYITRG
jgi:hypothetical protein